MLIRAAEVRDCAPMMELIKELAIYEKALDKVTVTLAEFEAAGFGKNKVWEAFVAENLAGEIVGMALYFFRYSTWRGTMLYLEDFVVKESVRGSGIGKMLFEKTLQHAQNIGCKGMCFQVLDWNEPAINFYKKYNANFDGEWLNVSVPYIE